MLHPVRSLKQKGPVLLNNLRKSYEGLTYYRQRPPLSKFVGVPLVEGEQEHLRGVLLADRKVDVAFAEEDKELLRIAAKEILRIVEAERRLNLMDVIRN